MPTPKSANTGKLSLKKGVGCVSAFVLLPLVAVALIFYVAGLANDEWKNARPPELSIIQWAEKRTLCESARLGATLCASTSTAEVRRIAVARAEQQRKELCTEDGRAAAIQEAQKAVLGQLRAPSTARFVSTATRASNQACNWTVTGAVDAQNAFGGTVRSTYTVKLRLVSAGTWLPLKVVVS